MKIKFIFLFIILTNGLQAQIANYLIDDFSWVDKDTFHLVKLKFEENGKFEFIEDEIYDCTPTFAIYGSGDYQIIKDSILLVFDSIPNLESESKIDSTNTDNEYSNLTINVVNEHGEKIKNAKLKWGKPKRKRKWITAQFFEEPFDESIELKFKNNEEVNFVGIEKEGYYWCAIKIPKRPNKDYKVEAVLRPKPMVASRFYYSNIKFKLGILSDCEIQFFFERILKKERCH